MTRHSTHMVLLCRVWYMIYTSSGIYWATGMVCPCPSLFGPRAEKRLLKTPPGPVSTGWCTVIILEDAPSSVQLFVHQRSLHNYINGKRCVFVRYQKVLVSAAFSVVWSLGCELTCLMFASSAGVLLGWKRSRALTCLSLWTSASFPAWFPVAIIRESRHDQK